VTATLTSLLNGASTTSPLQSTTVGVANPSPTITWIGPSAGTSTFTVTLGTPTTSGEAIYQPQIELPAGLTCLSATEAGGPDGVGCSPNSQQVTFDQPLLSGTGSVITVTVSGSAPPLVCPSVEWLSSTPTNQALTGDPTYVIYAWPRSGPHNDQRPQNEIPPSAQAEGNTVTVMSCPTV
jgi:hypothetical protein